MAFSKLLVGTDGSAAAEMAVEHAVGLARRCNAEVIVLHAWPLPISDPGPGGVTADFNPLIEAGREILRAAEMRHGADRIRYVLRPGDASAALLDTAHSETVDLVVVGNRGMRGARRLVLGSVPNRVSHHAACSVLIVHTTD